MEILIVVLSIVTIIALVRVKAYKMSLKALADYYRNKGYPMPTDEELKESSRGVIEQRLNLKEK